MNKITAPQLTAQELFKKIDITDERTFRKILYATNVLQHKNIAEQIEQAGLRGNWNRSQLPALKKTLADLSEQNCLSDDNNPVEFGISEFFNIFDVSHYDGDCSANIGGIYTALTQNSIPIGDVNIFVDHDDDDGESGLQISINKNNNTISRLRELIFEHSKSSIELRINQIQTKLAQFDAAKQDLIKKAHRALFADTAVHPLVYQTLLLAEQNIAASVSLDHSKNTLVVSLQDSVPPPSILVVPGCTVIVEIVTKTLL